jgi:hypothetical protein
LWNCSVTLAVVNAKLDEIESLKIKVKNLREELARLKRLDGVMGKKRHHELEFAKSLTLRLGGEWLKLIDMGLTGEDIICLYHVESGTTLEELANQLDVVVMTAERKLAWALCTMTRPPFVSIAPGLGAQLWWAIKSIGSND